MLPYVQMASWHPKTCRQSRPFGVSALMRALAFMAADEADDGRTDEVRPISKFVLNIGCKGSSSSNPALSAGYLGNTGLCGPFSFGSPHRNPQPKSIVCWCELQTPQEVVNRPREAPSLLWPPAC
jgi:hypothetical protein